jgi:hypothetical protein
MELMHELIGWIWLLVLKAENICLRVRVACLPREIAARRMLRDIGIGDAPFNWLFAGRLRRLADALAVRYEKGKAAG